MEKKMILSCPTLKKELLKAAEEAGFQGEIRFIPQSLHSSPMELQKYLQNMIDQMEDMAEILLCVSGCGGATAGLKAVHAPLVVPKTRDCVDILLSGENLKELKRPKDGFFLSHGWMEYMKNSRLDLNRILAEKGPEATEEYMRTMFRGFENFYIIDTGIYPLEEIEEYIQPLADMIGGRVSKIQGGWGILKKMAAGKIDDDFLVAQKGESVKEVLQRERHMRSFT